jgi:hypothetical protein
LLEFGLASKLGLADPSGELGRDRYGRRMIYLRGQRCWRIFSVHRHQAAHPRGRMRVVLDVTAPKGTLTIDDFSLLCEPTFKSNYTSDRNELKFSRLRFGFHMFPRGVVIIDGLLRGHDIIRLEARMKGLLVQG